MAAISEEPVTVMERTAPVQDAEAMPVTATSTPVIEEEADTILRAMAEYLGTARTFSFHAEVTNEDVILTNIKVHTSASVDVGLRRPNGLYVEYAGDVSERRIWFDGETLTILDAVHNVYGQVPVPSGLDRTLKELGEKYGAQIPLSIFVTNHPYAEMMEEVEFGFYLGLRHVNGIRCHHMVFVSEHADWQIWIEDGAQYVPRKLVITYKNEPEAPQFTAVFSDWLLSGEAGHA